MPGTDRRQFVTAASAATLASAWRTAIARPNGRPNVILLITDDQGYGDLSCHGNPYVSTPNLDRLHRESIRFTDFHVDPLCAPTRAALLTGQYAFRNGVTAATGGWSLLREGVPTMADLFRANGYQTGIFGKWHLGDNYPLRPPERGFEHSLVCCGGGIAQAGDYWGNDYFDDTFYENNQPKVTKGYCTDVFYQRGLRFIEQNQDRPFFLYLPCNAPHAPYWVSNAYTKIYREKGVPSPVAEFYGMITNVDENVGRLLRRLEQLKLYRSTVVIFMTDNGSAAGTPHPSFGQDWPGFDAGMRAAKGSAYEGGHRVPFFIRYPDGGWPTGRDISTMAAHIDVLPTLAQLCQLEIPKNVVFDGKSLVPLLDGRSGFPEDRMHFIQHNQIRIANKYQMEDPQPWRTAVALQGRWRLVEGKELYDLHRDLRQQNDLAGRHPEVEARLRSGYERWYEAMKRAFAPHVRIVIGSRREPVSRLSCFDWHGDEVPSSQQMIRNMMVANGYWALRAETAGRYEIVLRQRPAHVEFPIDGEAASIHTGGIEHQKPVRAGATSVAFTVDLPRGEFRLETAIHKQNEIRGAYYVDVRHVGS